MKYWIFALVCLTSALATGCGGDYTVDYAPVAACADVDLDPSACPR